MKPLQPGETIMAAVPEHCRGPGWENRIVWVYIRTRTGEIRVDAIQPEEQTETIRILFKTAAVASAEMLEWVQALERKGTR